MNDFALQSVYRYEQATSNGMGVGIWDALKSLEARAHAESVEVKGKLDSLSSEVEKLKAENAALREENVLLKQNCHNMKYQEPEQQPEKEALASQVSWLTQDMRVMKTMLKLTIASSDPDNTIRLLFTDDYLLRPEHTGSPSSDSTASSAHEDTSSHSNENGIPINPEAPANIADEQRLNAFMAFLIKTFMDFNDYNLATNPEAKQKLREYALRMIPSLPPGDGGRRAGIELALWEGMDLHWVLTGTRLDDLVKCREIYAVQF